MKSRLTGDGVYQGTGAGPEVSPVQATENPHEQMWRVPGDTQFVT